MQKALRRVGLTVGMVILVLLPAAAAIPPDVVAPADIPMAITQPLASRALASYAYGRSVVPESAVILLVGSGLIGVAAVMRRATRT